jgi:hypothetical protein
MKQARQATMIVRNPRRASSSIRDAAVITAGALGGLATGMSLGFLIWTLI